MEKYNLDNSTLSKDKTLIESQYLKMELDREIYLETSIQRCIQALSNK